MSYVCPYDDDAHLDGSLVILHMVRQAADAGELRAVADVLGHSPDMLMKADAHALPVRSGP